MGTLILGAVLALGHHAFNAWENGKPVYSLIHLLTVVDANRFFLSVKCLAPSMPLAVSCSSIPNHSTYAFLLDFKLAAKEKLK